MIIFLGPQTKNVIAVQSNHKFSKEEIEPLTGFSMEQH